MHIKFYVIDVYFLELAAGDREIQERHKVLSLDQFFEDFSSLIWLTYRKKFSQLAKSNLTSDGGWGCMLRTGQMLLANAILIHMLREGKNLDMKFALNYLLLLHL